MVIKSREGSMNEAIHSKLSNIPDPLHFELPHGHKKLLELIYVLVVIGAISTILMLGAAGAMTAEESNASSMVVLFLAIMLGLMIIEKSTIVHKPAKSSS